MLDARVVQGLLVAVAFIVLPHSLHLPLPLALYFWLIWLWRFWGIRHPASLPGGSSATLLLLLGIGLLVWQHPGEWGKDSGTALFLAALALKLIELHKPRDAYLVAYLGFILMGAQFLYRQDIAAAVYGFVGSSMLLAGLMAGSGGKLSGRLALAQGLRLLLHALPMAALLFVLFPRVPPPAWAILPGDKHQAKTGLSEVLEPGAVSELALSQDLVFRAKFRGEPPPQEELYWRGPVFSLTDGERWRVSNSDYAVYYQQPLQVTGRPYAYTLLLEPQAWQWVYALDMPYQYDQSLERHSAYHLTSRVRAGEAAQFDIVSYPEYNTGLLTKTEYRESLQLPDEPSERVVELVGRLQGFDAEPQRYLDNLLAYFHTQGFSYNLMPPLMPDKPIETFLFEAKTGFCNHYAMALVYLMRVADIPARVVAGYQGGEYNRIGGFVEVRQANAHAWAEVWLQDKGWVRVDPTRAVMPGRIEFDVNVQNQVQSGAVSVNPAAGQAQMGTALLRPVGLLWNSLEYQWQHWIVSYGSYDRGRLLQKTGLEPGGKLLLAGLLAGLLILALLALGLRLPKRRREDAALRCYRRFCSKLARLGLERAGGECPSRFAERAKALRPELASPIDDVTALFVQLYYGRREQDGGLTLRRLKSRVRNL